MKKHLLVCGAVVLFVILFAACSQASSPGSDVIVGSWVETTAGGSPISGTDVLQFKADNTLIMTMNGSIFDTGTWSKSGSTYTLSLLGFSPLTFTPTFSNSNNTMAYTDLSSQIEVYNRQ
jgi:hypothetical protein